MQKQLRKTKELNLLAYGRVYINNLKSKATSIFNELIANNELTQANFINEFKRKYPKDYDMLQYEWEFKVHEFKKNRKGAPKPHPIRPEKILSNMYKNYYFKIIKKPIIDEHKEKELSKMRGLIGKYGYKIKRNDAGMYNIINKSSKDIEYHNLDFKTLKQIFKQIATN